MFVSHVCQRYTLNLNLNCDLSKLLPITDKAYHMLVWSSSICWWTSVSTIKGGNKSRGYYHWRVRAESN